MKDMLSFLIARDTMHQQQWMAAIEDIGDIHGVAPNDVPDTPEHARYAYAFADGRAAERPRRARGDAAGERRRWWRRRRQGQGRGRQAHLSRGGASRA